jgi:hypothetical protein
MTVPVGTEAPVSAGVTVALKVTDWLTDEPPGREEVTAVVVAVWFTVCVNGPEEADLKFVSELVNAAVMVCAPAEVNVKLQGGIAPAFSGAAGQIVVAPSE